MPPLPEPAAPRLVVRPLRSEERVVRHGRLVRPAPPPVVLLATLTAAAGLATLADWLHLG